VLRASPRPIEELRLLARAHPELPVIAVFPLFLVAIAASNQEFNDYGLARFFTFRVLAPALAPAMLTIALAARRLPSVASRPLLATALLTGAIGSGQLLAEGNAGYAERESDARQSGAEAFAHLLVFRHGTDPIFRVRIDALPEELRPRAYRGLGFSFAHLYGSGRRDAPAAQLTRALVSIDPARRGDAIEGARMAIGGGLAQVAPLAPSPRRDELAAAIDLAGADPLPAPPDDGLAQARPGSSRVRHRR